MGIKSTKNFLLLAAILISATVVAGMTTRHIQAAATITVNSTADVEADDGECTLREAIVAANNDAASGATTGECEAGSGDDTIVFDIASGPFVISPTTELPAIDTIVVIDGLSQSGATPTAPVIVLDGTNASGVNAGFTCNAAATITGLQVENFPDGDGIFINQGDGCVVDSNTINSNGKNGIAVNAVLDPEITNNIIYDHRSTTYGNGISLNSSNGAVIQGNSAYSNKAGISDVDSSNMQIGGTSNNQRNYIYENDGLQAEVVFIGNNGETNIQFQNNYLGIKENGDVANPVGSLGILINGNSTDLLIGGTQANEGNHIAGKSAAAIAVAEADIPAFPITLTPNNVTIIGNSIYGTQAASFAGFPLPGLGIDLMSVPLDGSFNPTALNSGGPTLNDAADVDIGTNNYMNFPVLNSAIQSGTNLAVNFNLDAADSTDGNYRVEFFANDVAGASGYGEGRTFLGSASVTNGSSKTANLTLASSSSLAGKYITATTTAIDSGTASGFGATSEFSLAQVITEAATSGNGGGAGTSSSAELANTGQNTVAFMLIAGALVVTSGVIIKKQVFDR